MQGFGPSIALLARAESEIALIERVQPLGFDREYQRLLLLWGSGREAEPRFRYAPRCHLGRLKRALAAISAGGFAALEVAAERRAEREPAQPIAEYADPSWVAERAQELLLEARLVEIVGTSEFSGMASERFAPPLGALAATLESNSRDWIAQGAATHSDEPCFRSDDPKATQSLLSLVLRRVGRLRIPVRVLVNRGLVSVAACGDAVIVIRGNSLLTARAAARITEHEVCGHLLPRLAARARSDILCCGCAGASADEEGRALLIEERLGLMDPWRRAELGARHLASSNLRHGATFVDVVRQLVGHGASTELALRATMRAFRGGGLGREIMYLPAWVRLKRAFEAEPAVERWFERGRASLAYAIGRQSNSQAA